MLAFFLYLLLVVLTGIIISYITKNPGVGLASMAITFMTIQVSTLEVTEKNVRSEVDHGRLQVEGSQYLYVRHPEASFETSDAFLYENYEDTSEVKVVLRIEESVWSNDHSLDVRSK